MENHPIPQDITGFQFKLIGDMTVKQFAYLAGGAICAWFFYSLPISIFVRLPLAIFFAGIGVSLAFVPIEGRPMDTMIYNFIKAVFAPTQFIYQKTGGYLWPPQTMPKKIDHEQKDSLSEEKLKTFLSTLPKKPKNALDQKEMTFLQNLTSIYANTLQSIPSTLPKFTPSHVFTEELTKQAPAQPTPVPPKKADKNEDADVQNQEELVEKEALIIEKELETAKKLEAAQQSSVGYQQAHQKVLDLELILRETLNQKQELEKKLIELQRQLQQKQQNEVYKPSLAQPRQETKNVRSIPKEMGKEAGLPTVSEFPNLITGIIKDPRGNPLSNILVEVKDKEGNSVRAFKTNPIGQFASATPVVNGTYTIGFEDPRGENKFDTIEFNATGDVIMPIEVISVDKREEIRRSLFN